MPTLAEQYTLPEEREYLLINDYHLPYFAPGELAKIVNYEKASKDGYKGWHLHHRLELNPDGTTYKPKEILIQEDIYYQRPATELVFLTVAEHRAMHAKNYDLQAILQGSINAETKAKMRDAKLKTNGTENRYRLVKEAVERGETLCFRDYAFYRRYCLRNGIPFNGCPVDKSIKVSTIAFVKPGKDKKPDRFIKQVRRYRYLKSIVDAGESIGRRDAIFLNRFCYRNGWELPSFDIDYNKRTAKIPE